MISKETLFAASLFPYLGFLWFLTRSGKTPRLALIGFYMTLVFVAVTIPAGIYAKVAYGESLANVDWLHGSAEFFLTLSNILLVLGFRQAIIQHKRSSSSWNAISFALLTAPIAPLSPLTALCRLTQAKEIEERSASETSYSLLCGLVIDRCIQWIGCWATYWFFCACCWLAVSQKPSPRFRQQRQRRQR